MKTIFISVVAAFICTAGAAQENKNVLNKGTVLDYTVIPNGVELSSVLTLEKFSIDTVTFAWKMPATSRSSERSGRRSMLRSSLDASRQGYWEPPIDGEDILLAANESMLCLSRTSFAELKKMGKTEFDGQRLNAKAVNNGLVEYELNGRRLNAIRADSDDGNTRLWILDDANFPLILKLEGNPFSVDVEIKAIR
jgi:hypothetical protein